MKKRKRVIGRIKLAKKDTAPKTEVQAESPPAIPAKIKVKAASMPFRGARAAWYKRLLEHDGKEANAFLQSCKDKCPQLTKAGTPEDPRGWLNFFVRKGVAELVQS